MSVTPRDSCEDGLSAGAFTPLGTWRAGLGESPFWSPYTSSLWWVDCEGPTIIETTLDGFDRTWQAPETIGFLVPAGPQRHLAGLESGLFAFDLRTRTFERVLALDDPNVRFNDATLGGGWLWASTMHYDVEQPVGAVLRIGRDFSATHCIAGLRRPNGLAFDPARGRLYLSDSHPDVSAIWTAEVDGNSGATSDPIDFAPKGTRPGRPDGATLDNDGNYLVARIDAGLIDIMAPDGRLIDSIAVPVPEPTKPAFGGNAFKTLFVTSKSAGPQGGRLLQGASAWQGRQSETFDHP